MATGYTFQLVSHGQTLREFILTCAGGFVGDMHDRSVGDDIPDEIEPPAWHAEALAKAQETRERLQGMTHEEQRAFGAEQKREKLDSLLEAIRRETEETARLDQMLLQVLRWEPPTPDHEALKAFMLEQIKTSRIGGHDYYTKRYQEVSHMTPHALYMEAFEEAIRSVQYHTEQHEKQIGKTKWRNDWVRALKDSLPDAPHKPD